MTPMEMTQRVIEEAKQAVEDQGVFSEDQIMRLHEMIDKLAYAILYR